MLILNMSHYGHWRKCREKHVDKQRYCLFYQLRAYFTPIGRVHQQVQSYRRLSKKHCFGVKKSSFSLGLLLSLCCMALILASVKESKSACFGMYLLMSLFAFSIAPFCHEE